MKLLSQNPKVTKGEKAGYLTYILHLAPSWLSGYNTCPAASTGCAGACLNTSGRGGICSSHSTITGTVDGAPLAFQIPNNAIQAARIRKTRWLFEERPTFMADLVGDVQRGIRKAKRENMVPVFRLNGTSDIRWERIPVTVDGETFRCIMDAFPDVTFYDYTKLHNRRDLPANYRLTFSLSENNDARAQTAMQNGLNVAIPFAVKRNGDLPGSFAGLPVYDGDDTDLRFLDPSGVIVGLRAKGGTIKDTSGFIRAPGSGWKVVSLPVVA